jgi:uncharacterized protein (TIGR03437 family)
VHQRLESVFYASPLGATFTDDYAPPLSATYNDTASDIQYAFGSGGAYRIGAGTWPFLGLNVAVQAPSLSGSGVYLNPSAVINAASSAPFTAGISAGELIAIYGSNLAPATTVASSLPLPTKLGGVQITINNVPAPIYFVSSGVVAVLVPFAVNSSAGNVAQIQLSNNGTLSNTVTSFVYETTPGLFTVPAGGVGPAAIVHANGQLVTAANPATPGEIVEAFVTGLGSVTPSAPDGAAGPVGPFSVTQQNISVFVGGVAASTTCQYCLVALAPGEAALYQINLQLPLNAPAGTVPIEISGPDSYTAEATIAVAGAPSGGLRLPTARKSARAVDEKSIVESGRPIRQIPPVLHRLDGGIDR